MGRGRPSKIIPEVSSETINAVKDIAKSYQKEKNICAFIPQKRKSLFSRMQVSTEQYEATGCIDYDREAVERIHPEDRKVIKNYEEKMNNIWLLEHGVAAITDDRTREIAEDTLLRGKRAEDMIKKYNIGRMTAFREKRRAICCVAEFIEAHPE